MNLSKHYFNIQPGAWAIILIHIVAIEPAGDYLLGTLSTNTFLTNLDVLYSSAELLKQKKIFLPYFLKIIFILLPSHGIRSLKRWRKWLRICLGKNSI